MTPKRSKEEAASKWVQDEYRATTSSNGMACLHQPKIVNYVTRSAAAPAIIDAHSIETSSTGLGTHASCPFLKRAVAFEIWNGLHMRSRDTT